MCCRSDVGSRKAISGGLHDCKAATSRTHSWSFVLGRAQRFCGDSRMLACSKPGRLIEDASTRK